MQLAPVALFVYNRPQHVRLTVEALARNELAEATDLHIFADGPRGPQQQSAVDEVRQYINDVRGFKSTVVYERTANAGLATSIIEGVSRICDSHGRVIVVEDDLVTSPWFLTYMNQALDLYEEDERVASIHAYCYPVRETLPTTFFLRGADCWGWATWERAWSGFERDGASLLQQLVESRLDRAFDLDGAFGYTQMLRDQIAGLNDSWAVRWHASCFLKNRLTLYPGRSLVENIGNDASGTHCNDTTNFASALATEPVRLERIPLEASEVARSAFADFLRTARGGMLGRMLRPFTRRFGVFR